MKAPLLALIAVTWPLLASEMNPKPDDPDLCTPSWLEQRAPLSADAEAELIRALSSESSKVRGDAADRLGLGGGPAAASSLTRPASDDPSLIVRQLSLRALGRIGDEIGKPVLTAALQSANKNLRQEAAWSLGRYRDAAPALRRALRDESSHVRMAAACSLGKVGSSSDRKDLRAASVDSDPFVRAAAAWAQEQLSARSRGGRLIIDSVHVIDGSGAAARPGMTVVIENDRIVSVDAVAAPRERSDRVIDGKGLWLIPGLWDMHIHADSVGASSLALFIANGVTSARDMGGDLERLKALRAAIIAGEVLGPRLRIAGPALEGKGWPGSSRAHKAGGHVEVQSPADARRIVADLAARGVDFIKVRSIQDRETYTAVLDAGAQHELRVSGHPAWSIPATDPLISRQLTFEHGFYPYPLSNLKENERARVVRQFVDKGVVLVPTLVAWQPRLMPYPLAEAIVEDNCAALDYRRVFISPPLLMNWHDGLGYRREERREGLEGWRSVMREMSAELGTLFKAGVKVVPGTDSGAPLVFPGFSLADELELLVSNIGMTPMEALVAATSTSAAVAGDTRSGTIQAGARADLVLLTADPTEKISNVRLIEAVIAAGRFFDRKAITSLYAGARQPLDGCRSHPAD